MGQWFLAHGHRVPLLDIDLDTLASLYSSRLGTPPLQNGGT